MICWSANSESHLSGYFVLSRRVTDRKKIFYGYRLSSLQPYDSSKDFKRRSSSWDMEDDFSKFYSNKFFADLIYEIVLTNNYLV